VADNQVSLRAFTNSFSSGLPTTLSSLPSSDLCPS